MPRGIVCFPIDHGPARLMLFDLGREAGVQLPVGLWVDSLGSWEGGLLLWGWPQGDPRPMVWQVDPAGTAALFGPLAGRQVHGMGVGADGTVVVGVPPSEDAGWFHRGTNLLSCAPDGSEPRMVYEGRRLLWYPTIGPDGSIAVLEETSARRRLLVVRPDGSVERPPLKEEVGPRWGPQRVFWGAAGLLAVEGEDETGSLAMAILDDRFRLVDHFEQFRPHAWSPDGSALLVTQRGRRLVVLAAPGMTQAWAIGPPWWSEPIPQATWLPAALVAAFGQSESGESGREADFDLSTFRRTIVPVRPPTPAGPYQVVGADDLGSQGTVRVQLRGSDSARLAAVLRAAADDLIRLDTTEPEGDVETPSFVSGVQAHPAGPWVWIDANDTETALLDRIPTILVRHLEAAGITDAVIDLAPDV